MRDNRPLPKKKLYHVRFVLDTVVAATDAEDAKKVALRERDDIFDMDYQVIPPEVAVVGRIVSKGDCPKGWGPDSLPWGTEIIDGCEMDVVDYL